MKNVLKMFESTRVLTLGWWAHSRKLSEISVPEIRILAPSMEGGLDATPESVRKHPSSSEAPAPRSDITCEDEDGTSEHESMFSLQTSER